METSRAVAVLISDIHFTPATLELATSALRQALVEAFRLDVPLIIAGDTLDTKAIIRAECANKLISLLDQPLTPVYVLVGNHDLINEKGEDHALHFLTPYVTVIRTVTSVPALNLTLIPYMSDKEALKTALIRLTVGSAPYHHNLIMHQGVMGADMGHYVQDKTSLPPEYFDGFRVFSGHYHRHQTIKCGPTGSFTYIGNPYTLSFGEAKDGPKGFLVLNSDGSYKQVPTNLRKHVIHEINVSELEHLQLTRGDVHWVKVRGPASELAKIVPTGSYKLDLIPTDSAAPQIDTNKLTKAEILDKLIDDLGETDDQKRLLKQLWRDVLEAP